MKYTWFIVSFAACKLYLSFSVDFTLCEVIMCSLFAERAQVKTLCMMNHFMTCACVAWHLQSSPEFCTFTATVEYCQKSHNQITAFQAHSYSVYLSRDLAWVNVHPRSLLPTGPELWRRLALVRRQRSRGPSEVWKASLLAVSSQFCVFSGPQWAWQPIVMRQFEMWVLFWKDSIIWVLVRVSVSNELMCFDLRSAQQAAW